MAKNEYEKVIEAVEDRFYEKGQLSAVRDIVDWTGLTESRVRNLVEKMTGSGLYKIYEGPGKPTVFITENMKNSLTAQAGEPDWIGPYQFQEKVEISNEIEEKQKKMSNYQEIEGLLYTTGEQLEDSVERGLDVLGFTPDSTEDDEDFIVRYDDKMYIIEVKGKGGSASKSDVAQLGTWLDKWSEKEDPEKLRGILVVNHHRHDQPEERGAPLTEKAESFLSLRPAFYVATPDLFDLVKQVKEGKLEKDEARKKLLEGDPDA